MFKILYIKTLWWPQIALRGLSVKTGVVFKSSFTDVNKRAVSSETGVTHASYSL